MNNAHLGGTIPSELGQWTALTANLNLESNNLCGDVPTQLEALSSGFDNTDTWKVTEGNSFIGTPCWQLMMTVGGSYIHVGDTTKTDMPYSSEALGGSIPTEFGMYTDLVAFNLKDNSMLGTVPTQVPVSCVDGSRVVAKLALTTSPYLPVPPAWPALQADMVRHQREQML